MITFDRQDISVPVFNEEEMRRWIKDVAACHARRVGDVAYLFCSDAYILDVNRRFLNHDYFTDVITFDNSCGKRIDGDIIISMDTVLSNAEGLGVDFRKEWLRVIIHGILHLCGINDKAPGEREVMERYEDEALNLVPDYEI